MKLEDQCIRLELAIHLKKLGVKQDSLFYHYNEPYSDGEDDWVITDWNDYYESSYYSDRSEPYSAFTCSELGEMLPITIIMEKHRSGKWRILDNMGNLFSSEKESDARAKMLIYLIENNLHKIED